MKKINFDIIVIGLGPAGMAVSAMGSEIGLSVCAIEKHNIGGECMNVGCIPSKAIIRIAEKNPNMSDPFSHIQKHLAFIKEKKVSAVVSKATVYEKKGHAEFVDPYTVKVGDEYITAKKIFIATGTTPQVPPIKGIDKVDYLTNENLFNLEKIPESMVVIGGGAIGSEMADAFAKMGCECTIVHDAPHLLPNADSEMAKELEKNFKDRKITVHNSEMIESIDKKDGKIAVMTKLGKEILAEKLLIAAGRKYDFSKLNLEKANVEYDRRGIKVNDYLQTSAKHIYAVGDCNGHFLLSHAAMHQGMIGLMNSMSPWFLKKNFKKFPLPWTVFTSLEVSMVGMSEKELKARDIKYTVIETKYKDYGAAIAEDIPYGFVKVFASKMGKIYGAAVVGHNSGEIINEFALAIQNNVGLYKIMMTMHSFPTMGFLTKRIGEIWMMGLVKSDFVRKIIKFMFKIS